MPNMKELMEKAKEMQQQMQEAQKEILSINVEGVAGGGMVKINMNGAHQIPPAGVKISPTLMEEDEEMLGDLIAAAINDASKKIEEVTKEKMTSMAKDMKLPEDFGNLGDGEGE